MDQRTSESQRLTRGGRRLSSLGIWELEMKGPLEGLAPGGELFRSPQSLESSWKPCRHQFKKKVDHVFCPSVLGSSRWCIHMLEEYYD